MICLDALRQQNHGAGLLQRSNAAIGRRTGFAGVLPNEAAITALKGTRLLGHDRSSTFWLRDHHQRLFSNGHYRYKATRRDWHAVAW